MICIGNSALRDAWLVALFRAVQRAPARFCLDCRALIDLSLSKLPNHMGHVRQVLRGEPFPLDRFLVIAGGHYAIYRHVDSFRDRMSLALVHLDAADIRVHVKGPNRIEISRRESKQVDVFLVDDSAEWLTAFTDELEPPEITIDADSNAKDGSDDVDGATMRHHRQAVGSFGLFEPGATRVVELSAPLSGNVVGGTLAVDIAQTVTLLRPAGADTALGRTVLPAIVVDVSHAALGIALDEDLLRLQRLSLVGCALVLRTGLGAHARAQPFVRLATAKKLIDSGVQLVAIDCPSLGAPDDESHELHKRLAKANVAIALNLGGDIDELPVDGKFALHIVPMISDGDSVPARAFAVVLSTDDLCGKV